jgi:DNA polymerase-3 subunit delta'
MLDADSLPPLLFAGPAGTGKRTLALRLAQRANCQEPSPPCTRCTSCRTTASLNHPDHRLLFPIKAPAGIDPSSPDKSIELTAQATIERYPEYTLESAQPVPDPRHFVIIWQVRWLRREIARPPLSARTRFYNMLHADRMNREATNALLKMLEEPQRQTTFVLTTDRPSQLLDTIRSRCRLVRFTAIPEQAIADWLTGRKDVDKDDALTAAQMSDGSMRRALDFLEDPDSFLCPAVLDFFRQSSPGEAEVLATMHAVGKTPVQTVVGTLIYLFRQTLRAKAGIVTPYASREPSVRKKAGTLTIDYLRRVITFLSERYDDCRLPIERRLFLYTLLSSVRRPSR